MAPTVDLFRACHIQTKTSEPQLKPTCTGLRSSSGPTLGLCSQQLVPSYTLPDVPLRTVIWKIPKIRGPNIDPQIAGLLLQGLPKRGPPFLETAIGSPLGGSWGVLECSWGCWILLSLSFKHEKGQTILDRTLKSNSK